MAGITRREQILEAAAKVFNEMGYHRAKIGDIAAQAGVGKGTIYEYFSSKKELFEEALFHVLEVFFSKTVEDMNDIQDPTQKLKGIIVRQNLLLKKSGHIGNMVMKNSGDIHSDLLDRLVAYRKKVLGFIAGIIEEGIEKGVFREVDPHLAAILFMGVLQESGAISYRGSRIGDKALDTMLDYMLKGIGKQV